MNLASWPIVEVIPDSPAAEAGLQNGDLILRVNDTGITKTITPTEALKLVTGPSGKTVKMVVKRGKHTLTLEAKKISKAAAMVRNRVVEPGILYIKIPTFEGSGVERKVKQFVHRLPVELASVVILDVRDNNGGRPEEANAVADIFLDDKILQIAEFRNHKRIAFRSHRGAV